MIFDIFYLLDILHTNFHIYTGRMNPIILVLN